MDDFSVPTAAGKDRIYVSWEEAWDIGRYVGEYLQAKRCAMNEVNRQILLGCIENFPAGHGMITKVNMDFWLESNGLTLEPAPRPSARDKQKDF